MVAGDKKENLKYSFMHNIQNLGTRSVIREAYRRQEPPLDGMAIGEFTMDPHNLQKQLAFLALLGTDNARPIEYMLKDHFVAAGRKKIQKITVFPHKRDETMSVVMGWNMVLEIGRDA